MVSGVVEGLLLNVSCALCCDDVGKDVEGDAYCDKGSTFGLKCVLSDGAPQPQNRRKWVICVLDPRRIPRPWDSLSGSRFRFFSKSVFSVKKYMSQPPKLKNLRKKLVYVYRSTYQVRDAPGYTHIYNTRGKISF